MSHVTSCAIATNTVLSQVTYTNPTNSKELPRSEPQNVHAVFAERTCSVRASVYYLLPTTKRLTCKVTNCSRKDHRFPSC